MTFAQLSKAPAVLLGCFLCLLSITTDAQEHKLPAAQLTSIESAVSKFMATTHVPGVAVSVVENGVYEWAEGFGMADMENNVPASEHTLFRLGSISKPITAIAAMELWERGKLDLDVPVQKYCPSFPQKSQPITTRELLGHLAGNSSLQVRLSGRSRDRQYSPLCRSHPSRSQFLQR